ncbi:MAG: prepilin-type N-terminal cleavage/methylation domain-containing protein [Opitutales bacterium]
MQVSPNLSIRRGRTRRGFTLVEVMIALFITLVTVFMALGFFSEMTESSFVSSQKNEINADIRKITQEMTVFAREANLALLYASFDAVDCNAADDRLGESNSGDFMLLVFQGSAELDADGRIEQRRPIERLIGYYRSPADPLDPSSEGPVRKFDVAIPSTDRFGEVEDLIQAHAGTSGSHHEVIELSEGLADGRLFYNFWNKSVMINGKIVHGNAAKRVTNTYNFTISTRG